MAALAGAVTASVWGHSLGTQVQTVVISVAGALIGLEALISSKAPSSAGAAHAVEAAVQQFFQNRTQGGGAP